MKNGFVKATAVTVFVAVLGYFATYYIDLQSSSRKAKLERVNLQLKNLYGPLYGLTSANYATWTTFTAAHWPGKKNIMGSIVTSQDQEIWRDGMLNMFNPTNEKMYEIIINNTDLIIENKFPKEFAKFCAHYETYRPVIAAWKENRSIVNTSLIDYPDSIHIYTENSYNKLKNEQLKLLSAE